MRPSARLIGGKTGVNYGRTEVARLANLCYAVIEQAFFDLHDPEWRADAEAFFTSPDHAAHRQWVCGIVELPEVTLHELYQRAQERLLVAGPLAVWPGPPASGERPS